MKQLRAAADLGRRILWRAATAVVWPVSSRWRFVVTGWTFGLIVVGNASAAHAGTGFIVSPDLGHTGGQTVFEKYDVSAYGYPVDTDSDHSGLGTSQLWNLVNAVTVLITWAAMSLLRGALAAVQWMLHLTIYADQSGAIDKAMSSLATTVFLPLLATTMAIGGFTIYAKGRRDGGGIIGELAWFVAATIFALTFVLQPSSVLNTVDGARASLSDAMMTGYTHAAGGSQSSLGIAEPNTGSDTNGAVRQLTDGLWNTYGVSEWCFIAWDDLGNCKKVGPQYLDNPSADSGPWGDARQCMTGDGNCDPFGADTPWVRGQDPGRLGAALLMALLITVPAAICLLVLFVFGLMASVGVIVLIFLGALFLAGWMIPGRPRAIGVRWLEMTMGTFLQSLMITTIIGAVMVVGSIFNSAVGTYGIFITAVLNLVALFLGLRYRAQLEHMIGFGTHATGNGVVSSYMAARMITGGARMGGRVLGRAGSAGMSGAQLAGRGAVGAARGANAGAQHVAQAAYARRAWHRVAPLRPATAPTVNTAPPNGPRKPPPPAAAPAVAVPAGAAAPASSGTPHGRPTPPPPPPAASTAGGGPRMVPKPAGRPAPASPPPPPPSGSAPRMATPAARPARTAPSGSTPPPPPPPATPRMTAPARRYQVPPVPRADR